MMYFYDGNIITTNSRKQAVVKAASSKGIRLYFMNYYKEAYLFSFNCGLAKKLKNLNFELDNYYYVKPTNAITAIDYLSYSIQSDNFEKLLRFKNPTALKELKSYVATAAKDDDDEENEVYYVVIENQGMLLSYEAMKGFTKIPCKPLCKKIRSASDASALIKKIQKIGSVDNLDELNGIIKAYFGSELIIDRPKKVEVSPKIEPKIEPKVEKAQDYRLEFTDSFLREQYALFNRRYFNNRLPHNIQLTWQSTKSRDGACFWKCINNSIVPTQIKMNQNIKTYNEFRNTLVHEMCHADCYQSILPEKINEADSLGKRFSTKWLKFLELTDDTAHNGRFAWLIDMLNKKFPELNLGRFSHSDYANRDESGNLKEGVLDKVKEAHLLVRDYQGKKSLFLVTPELYKEIVKNIGSSRYPFCGAWTEYYINPEKMANVTTNVSKSLISSLRYQVLTEMKRVGALKGGIKFLGGSSNQRLRN